MFENCMSFANYIYCVLRFGSLISLTLVVKLLYKDATFTEQFTDTFNALSNFSAFVNSSSVLKLDLYGVLNILTTLFIAFLVSSGISLNQF